ncbi:saccharopine dehydrogenase NADP-binding domain-containing protein [Luteimonas saliphila]|uniref:saccharopine dehydrogenase NADP-binding domain-containing protein n=1 Tax=Luteimonas saliphila TaxID=2804919 RepID=UPI00192E1570|nr:saccharopine dehydrogenase NADP-binding domain-containing protein [Luteimonas saliphila]
MTTSRRNPGTVAVYGAGGHTGGFVLDLLARRGIDAVAVGRRIVATRSQVPFRVAALDDAPALARAFAGCAVVINVAGPFLDTAVPVIEAALAAGCHYIDVTAEQESARATLHDHDAAARARGVALIPAAGFYGGLADLLASALAGDAAAATPIGSITVAVALDHWWPTAGTRRTGARNTFPRVVVEDGRLVPLAARGCRWDFGPPRGAEDMEAMPFSEIVTLAHHLPARRIDAWLGTRALRDIRDPATAPPTAVDSLGRSAQRFTMQVALEDARGTRRASAHGQDVYAVSAPLVVEAAKRLMADGPARAGAQTLGSAFDPRGFLGTIAPEWIELAMS